MVLAGSIWGIIPNFENLSQPLLVKHNHNALEESEYREKHR